jgi:hypothetical protein
MMRLLLSALFLSLSACASQPLTAQESAVRVLRKSDADKSCKEMGKVHAPGAMSVTDEGREADLKRETHKVGGNTVTVDRQDENMTIFGTAYLCKI